MEMGAIGSCVSRSTWNVVFGPPLPTDTSELGGGDAGAARKVVAAPIAAVLRPG
jgi:hypothetical protein